MIRRWIFWLLIIAFIWVLVSRFTEIEKLLDTLKQGRWQWVLVAILLLFGYHIASAALYQSAFYTVEVEGKIRHLIPLTFGAVFANMVAPTAGSAGIALFVNDAGHRGQSEARATAGTFLVSVTDFCAFTLILIIGIIYLFLHHELKFYEITAAVILLLLTGGQASVLVLGMWKPSLLHRVLTWLQGIVTRLAGWFKQKSPFKEDWAAKNSADFTDAARAIRAHPDRLGRTLIVALAAHIINLLCLGALFLAFRQHIKPGVMVAGYAMGILLLNASPVPQGIGVVEGTMSLVFTSLNIPGGTAMVITLAFRGLTFWLPLILGFFMLKWVKSSK